jgi:hypothetical protein
MERHRAAIMGIGVVVALFGGTIVRRTVSRFLRALTAPPDGTPAPRGF